MDDLYSTAICYHTLGDLKFTSDDCPRCRGNNRYFDLVIDVYGEFQKVSKGSRLRQDVEKCLLDHVGTNGEDSRWGSALYGVKVSMEPQLARSYIYSSVISAVKRLRELLVQENNQYSLPLEELIAQRGIGDFQVYEDPSEPRKVSIQLTIVSEGVDRQIIVVPIDF